MAEGNDSHLESVYSTLLETLEGKQREQLVKCMEAPEAALRIALQEGEDALEELEQVRGAPVLLTVHAFPFYSRVSVACAPPQPAGSSVRCLRL